MKVILQHSLELQCPSLAGSTVATVISGSGSSDELGEIVVMDKQILLILAMDGYAV